jgi:hypothetical protein
VSGETERVKVRRLGVVVELENGDAAMIYTDQAMDAVQVDIVTKYPELHTLLEDPFRQRYIIGPPDVTVTVSGIHAYTQTAHRVTEVLDTMAGVVRP